MILGKNAYLITAFFSLRLILLVSMKFSEILRLWFMNKAI